MPNFDGGHYFFACLLPVRHSPTKSHEHALRAAISVLPTGFPFGMPAAGIPTPQPPSPFAASTKVHFARLVVVGDTIFNGRDRSDAISVAIGRSPNPLVPNIVDQLSCAYLLVSLDLDARSGDRAQIAAILAEFWSQVGPQLVDVFAELRGYQPGMAPEKVAELMLRCQIDTAMPFNDYWPSTPPLADTSKWVLAAPGIAAFVAVAAVVLLVASALAGGTPVWAWIVALLLGVAAGAYVVYRTILRRALAPLPNAPHGDLPSVLKALYLQHRFVDFALNAQGKSAADLHRDFGAFLAAHAPSSPQPTQKPGVIR